MARRKRRRPTKRFFITIAVLACIVMLVVFLLLQGPSEALITEGNLFVDKSVETLIVRDEKVYNSDNYSTATFFASEGQNVTKGATIAQVYKWGYNEKLMTDYLTTQQEIQDYQENTVWREVVNKDLNTNNGKINNTIQEIVDVVQGNSTSDLVVLERKLRENMEKKQQFLKTNVQADDKLTGLYTKEQEQLNKLANWRQDVQAEDAGIVSFYMDGWETQLTPYNLDSLTKADIEAAKKGVVTSKTSDESTTRPLYRLVNNYKWYCLILLDKKHEIPELREGGSANMTFEGYFERPYSAKVTSVRTLDSGDKLYILEMTEDIGPLLSVRTADAQMHLDFTGMMVPEKAIFTQDDQKLIKLVQGDTANLIPVDVLISDGENCIIKSLDADTTLSANQKVLLR